MTQASAQDGADGALRREWDKQSIYLRLQEGIPTAFWVSGDLVSPLELGAEGVAYQGHFGWGRADEATMALAQAIVARLVAVGLVPPSWRRAARATCMTRCWSSCPPGSTTIST